MDEKAYAGSQTLQSIILLITGTNKGGGYFAPKWLFKENWSKSVQQNKLIYQRKFQHLRDNMPNQL